VIADRLRRLARETRGWARDEIELRYDPDATVDRDLDAVLMRERGYGEPNVVTPSALEIAGGVALGLVALASGSANDESVRVAYRRPGRADNRQAG
jgi:hypothetical protein